VAVLPAWLCGLVGLASWLQYYPLSEPAHRFWAISPSLGAFAYYTLRLARGRVAPVTIGLGMLALPLFGQDIIRTRQALTYRYVEFPDIPVLRGMRIPADQAGAWSVALSAITGYTRTHRDATMVIYGHDAIYATLVPDLRNPSPFYAYWQLAPLPPGLFEARRAFIAERKPLLLFEDQIDRAEGREIHLGNPADPSSYAAQRRAILSAFAYRELARFASESGDYTLYEPDTVAPGG
jgi:hypothetical protein